MVHRDLGAIGDVPLPAGLTLRPVGTAARADAEVALPDAAAAALRSDPTMPSGTDLDSFVAYLEAIPDTRFLAAVDGVGVVRATAAAATWAGTAAVFFVNTDPGWRGRGIGTAMTAAALRAAVAAGADRACLDASALGLSIYQRLGFTSVGQLTQYAVQR
jgi:ribosomal protein S18 acetylase RimI-like enzyme